MYSKKDFLNLVEMQDFKHVQIFDLNGRRIGGKGGTASKPNTPQDIIDYVNAFTKNNPGVYKIEAKKNFNNLKDAKFIYERVNLVEESPAVANKGAEVFVDSENLSRLKADTRAEVMAEVKAEQLRIFKEQQDKELREQYEAKTKELDTVAGKLMHIGTALLNGLIQKSPVLNGLLNGNTNEMPENHTTTTERQLSNEEIAKANEALRILISHMEADTLMKFAQKVQADPSVVSTLLKFL